MGFRIVKVNTRCKLETQLGYLVYRADEEKRILLDDISLLVLENQQICITTALMSELLNHKVRILLCDSKHNPQGEVLPYAACFDTSAKIKKQFAWPKETADTVWASIVRQKIRNQAYVLNELKSDKGYQFLTQFSNEVLPGDTTNREGIAAKTYFANLFGQDFDRRKDSDIRNIYLNYGYSLVLGAVNREISGSGYLTQLGIHHIGETNPFNLGCDLMEPFRAFVDEKVATVEMTEDNFKTQLMNLLAEEILCDGKTTIFENAIHNYVLSVLSALTNNTPKEVLEVTFLHGQ